MSDLPIELENVEVGASPEESLPATQVEEVDPFMEEMIMLQKTFTQLNEIFSHVIEKYDGGKQQLIRAWKNAAISPLNQSELHFSYPEEREIFELYTNLESTKLMLMVHGLKDAGVLKLHKPLMSAMPKTSSEVELNKMLGDADKLADEVRELQSEQSLETILPLKS